MKRGPRFYYREPLASLVGRWEAHMLAERHYWTTPGMYSRSLERFFSKFPKKSAPEQIHLADTEDWRVWRAEEGAAYSTIRKELGAVRAFYSWLINEVGGKYADMPNPVIIPVWPEPRGPQDGNL